MNKKLLAAALGVAFTAPVFADSSNVTLYGRLHMVADHQSVETAAGETGGNFTLGNASSRLGVKGQEDLGGGLKVVFGYEFAIDADSSDAGDGNTSQVTNQNGAVIGNDSDGGIEDSRHSYVGLGGSWGTVVFGTQDGGNETVAPVYTATSAIAGGLSNNGGPLTQVQSRIGSNDSVLSGNQRENNAIGYSGTFYGVKIEARHVLNGQNDVNNSAVAGATKENGVRETELAAYYDVGGLKLIGAVFAEDTEDSLAAGRAASTVVENSYVLGAQYSIGSLKLSGGFQVNEFYSAAANGEDSDNNFLIAGTYKLSGASTLYGMYGDGERNAAGEDLTQYQIMYGYDFSKRTRVYAGYQSVEREAQIGGAVVADTQNLTFGLRHNF